MRHPHGLRAAAGAAVSGNHWILDFSSATHMGIKGIAVDASKNSYVAGFIKRADGQDGYIAKVSDDGTLVWDRKLGGTADKYTHLIAVGLDSSANAYVVGSTDLPASNTRAYLAKYDTSGTLQWQRYLTGTVFFDKGNDIAVDSSGNSHIATEGYYGSGTGASIHKFNSSGTKTWSVLLEGNVQDGAVSIALDASGNVYAAGFYDIDQDYTFELFVVKLNSSGVVQWKRSFTGVSGFASQVAGAIAVDSSGNVYVNAVTSSYAYAVLSWSTSGSYRWGKIYGGSSSLFSHGLSVDSGTNSLYAATTPNFNGFNPGFAALSSSTGNSLGLARKIEKGTNEAFFGHGIEITSSDYFLTIADSASFDNAKVARMARLPLSGAKTGTYGAYSYTPWANTMSTLTGTEQDATALVVTAHTFTGISTVATSVAAGLTVTKTTV